MTAELLVFPFIWVPVGWVPVSVPGAVFVWFGWFGPGSFWLGPVPGSLPLRGTLFRIGSKLKLRRPPTLILTTVTCYHLVQLQICFTIKCIALYLKLKVLRYPNFRRKQSARSNDSSF